MNTEELKQAIADAESIAKTGTREEKEDFAAWAGFSIAYYSSQYNEEARANLKTVNTIYTAYLKALSEANK